MLAQLRRMAGSVGVKVGGIIVLMAALAVSAVAISLNVFGAFSADLTAFENREVPALRRSSSMTQAVSEISESMSQLLIAGSSDDISGLSDKLGGLLETFDGYAKDVREDLRPGFVEDIATMGAAFDDLADARRTELEKDNLTLEQSDALMASAAAATARLQDIWATELERARDPLADPGQRDAVERMDMAVTMERAVAAFLSATLSGASADDLAGVAQAAQQAAELFAVIEQGAANFASDAELAGIVRDIGAETSPDTGILALRAAVVDSRGKAETASATAAAAVAEVTALARGMGGRSVDRIEAASTSLNAAADSARARMWVVAAACGVILAAAPAGLWFLLVRPLGRLIGATGRLAAGDTAPVPSYAGHGGEIASLASALQVFRQNFLDRQRMQEEERAREAEQREETLRREREDREREARERQREAEALEAQREQEARELREREEMRAGAEAVQRRQQEEQDQVVRALADGLKSLASGDLMARIDAEFPEAYEELRGNFNAALGKLAELVIQISGRIGEISGTSSEISSAADDLSRRTEQSAATLQETSAALNQLTAAVETAADRARRADGLSRAANSKAEESGEVVQQAVSAMSEIDDSSRKISKIIDVIDDIAFQTNLLALNAGVEAARAGEAGRGFAVVASEVRGLAQRSSEAAREINDLISSSTEQIQRGVKLVDHSGQALREIIAAVAEIAGNVSDISASAQEQALGIKEINSATVQLETGMQQNAAMTEETTAASFALSKTAEELKAIAAQFRTGAAGQSGSIGRAA
ncbi:methyl-accepting chemotaxis protein [Mangrovicoccus sp. HB161399]|uniref:methyl-accepting chemotaxis protein n=1 Tax=Mangrovicoccus sp. HB161399 TaxID=2720392 RepID=UPI00155466B7|nr:methyl-accepting chemotaxis protein [Mangrovicoccus sp. HB161399]